MAIFEEIAAINATDGVIFDPASFTVDPIRDETEYGGVRIKGNATVDNARVRVVIDIAFGDAVEPGVQEIDLPVLLDFPAPKLRSYPRETVVAEKFQAMVALGLANSRMKDFYGVWVLIRSYKFEGDALARAIQATFERRNTEIPTARPD
ncbi:hypothetical protein J2R76_003695 [Bradyrhizobium sp. USDA 4532]|uniref:nucleotidyl transferase AbiEii/AbiGii toxin family protein n=1 Tax=unclassified Bradyrhizobium TaxID=2631580 RepID=UPI0020A176ED|nr:MULTISPECIES: nucleotidyl transferase AbiEii/AbiGii toxin family protein [unclassified Bradyrhizobium]MCP1835358.1 hypothetical protein [Bradyrhizobium sp. USDA 4545]MCP1920104.1 hypothetical protein [Bradyrhizobium sp. USDA 4532]